MIILGIDYGTKNIGLAVSDETELVAGALPILPNYGDERAVADVVMLIIKQRVGSILLGVPMRRDSEGNELESEMTKKIKSFGKKLAELSGLPVKHWDESFSSASVEKNLRGKKRKASDSLVAEKLLQEFLNYQRGF